MKSPTKANINHANKMISKKLFTLVFLKRNNSVLLGFKTRGLGKGLWNGFGGKIEQNETVVNCAKRELKEECNLIANDLKHIGVVKYEADNEDYASIVHIFTSSQFEGTEKPSEEMNPIKWYKFNEVPFEQMWPDARKWHHLMWEEKYFSAHVIYDNNCIVKESINDHSNLANALQLAQ